MNRVRCVALRVAPAAIILCFGSSLGMSRLQAQVPTQTPPTPPAATPPPSTPPPTTAPPAEEPKEEDSNPFAPEPAPVWAPGMSGSDATDPRAMLTPGLYDAGETAMGMKHLVLVKKPD